MLNTLMYQTLDQFFNNSNASLSGILVYVQANVPIFFPLLIFCLWLITLLGTYFGEIGISGRGDFLSSFAVANIFIAIVTIIGSNISYAGIPFIPFIYVVPIIALAVAGIAILFMQNTEQQ